MSNMSSDSQTTKKPDVVRWVGGVAIVLSACLLLVAIGVAGFFFYTDHYYTLAAANIDKKDYAEAMSDLGKVVSFYKSAPKLMQYAQASAALQDHNFYGAKQLYKSLDDFKDSSTMVNEADYQQALSYLSHNDFDKAKELFLILGSYRDSEQQASEADYLHAKYLLSQGDFTEAKDMFQFMDPYKDSTTLITECDYQQAVYWLDQANFNEALSAFKSLADANYKDSSTQLMETKYRLAKQSFDAKDYNDSLAAFLEIKDYKDSAAMLASIYDLVYNRAVASYRAKSYSDAYDDFTTVGAYQRSADYLVLISAHDKDLNSLYDDPSGMGTLYAKLTGYGGFEDAASLRVSDAFIHLRLEGKWKDKSGNDFELYFQKDNWYMDSNLPCDNGKYYKITDCSTYFGDDQTGWKKDYTFSFTAENTMTIFDSKDGVTYTMIR